MGSVSGFLSMVHQIAGGVGALVGGSIFDYWGSYTYAFFCMLTLSVLATYVTWLLRDRAMTLERATVGPPVRHRDGLSAN
jgi:nitrate/nitrite transporter NarK